MRTAIRCAFLCLAIVGVASIDASGQSGQSGTIFGRPTHASSPGSTLFVGASGQEFLATKGLDGKVLIVFPDSSMTLTADSWTWKEDSKLTLTGHVSVNLDIDGKAVFDKIVGN